MNHFQRLFSVAILLAIAIGCSPQGPPRTPTFPVTGQVYVDGQPAAELAVFFTNANGVDKEQPTFSTANTDAEGKFKVSTYESGDGIPEGTYAVTFMWGQVNFTDSIARIGADWSVSYFHFPGIPTTPPSGDISPAHVASRSSVRAGSLPASANSRSTAASR